MAGPASNAQSRGPVIRLNGAPSDPTCTWFSERCWASFVSPTYGVRAIQGRAQRWPEWAPHPSGRAEKRRARGGKEHCKMLFLQALTHCGWPSGVNEVNKASFAVPPLDRASQVARSEAQGHGKWGRLSFAFFSSAGAPVAEQRKEGALAGRTPRPPTLDQQQKIIKTNASNKSSAACPHRAVGSPPFPQRRKGEDLLIASAYPQPAANHQPIRGARAIRGTAAFRS